MGGPRLPVFTSLCVCVCVHVRASDTHHSHARHIARLCLN